MVKIDSGAGIWVGRSGPKQVLLWLPAGARLRLPLFVLILLLAQGVFAPSDAGAQVATAGASADAADGGQNWMEPTAAGTDGSASRVSSSAVDGPAAMFDHSYRSRFWVSGQVNFIFQYNPGFCAKYSGAQSFGPRAGHATSRVVTLYTGVRVSPTTEALVDIEETGGGGLSQAFGLAGFANLDVARNPALSKSPYLSRVMFHQIIPLGKDWDESEPTAFSLFKSLPSRRLELRAGKFSLVDFFDVSGPGSDSHLQFMNWTVDNNGAYDYAADTRGYTWGILAEYDQPGMAVRFAEALMPNVANGINLDWNLARARGENLEIELRGRGLARREAIVRLLAYANHAHMGSYRQAVADYLTGRTTFPDIVETERQGRVKFGIGASAEQQLPRNIRVFARGGWNEGRHESFAFTEVDNTLGAGGDLRGFKWHRPGDKAGIALVSNGLSRDHSRYLALGGSGFLLGDGRLNYGRETIVEGYYNAHLWRGVYTGLDLQRIDNPGYNRDRGPALVASLRLHLEF